MSPVRGTSITDESVYSVEEMQRFVQRLLEGVGLPDHDAEVLSRSLLDADMSGVRSHGLRLLPAYLSRLFAGAINPRPHISVVHEDSAVTVFDGDDGFGQVVVQRVLEHSLQKAREFGMSTASVRGSNHLGSLGYFTRLASEQGMFALLCQNTRNIMAPAGGRGAGIGNNPFAMAMPMGGTFPLSLDIGCSEASRHSVVVALGQGRAIPEGWALDEHGEPTTDPRAALRGAMLPFGGHKGYGLAVVMGSLAAVLSGASVGPDVPAPDNFDVPRNLGHFVLLVDLSRFGDLDDYGVRSRQFAADITLFGEDVRLPGESGARRRQDALAHGVPVETRLLETFLAMAKERGLKLEQPLPLLPRK